MHSMNKKDFKLLESVQVLLLYFENRLPGQVINNLQFYLMGCLCEKTWCLKFSGRSSLVLKLILQLLHMEW